MNANSANIQPSLIKLLLAIAGLLVIPHIGQLKPLFIGLAFALIGWRGLSIYRPKLLPNKWILLPLALLLGFIVMKNFGMAFGRDASSSLLIILMGLKLLESRNQRDVQAVIYMCFFVLITPFLFDQRIELALYGLLVFFALLFALIINNSQSDSLKNIALLRICGSVLLQAIPLMLVFFLLFPRMIGPLWSMPDEQSAVSGLSDQINPGSVSNLALSAETAFRVRFRSSAPTQKELYWRGPVFWETNGQRWVLRPPRKASFQRAINWPKKTSDYQYTLMMEPHKQFWLYALDSPSSAPDKVRLSADRQLLLAAKLSRNLSFELRSSISNRLTQLNEEDRQRGLKIPENTNPKVLALAEKWRSISAKPRHIVRQALQYYNREFYYTLTPPSLGSDPIAEFLFETKRGFCGHFATSFATLMRAAGIPARLIGGYQGGVYNQLGDFYTIRQADAHVWVEVWLDEEGWVRVDPTAAIAPNRIEHSIDASLQRLNGEINFILSPPDGIRRWAQQLNWVLHSVDYYWQNAVLAYGPEKQHEFLAGFGIIDWRDMITWLSILSATLIGLSMAVFFILQRPSIDPVQQSYLKLCKKLAKKSSRRFSYETSSDYFSRIQPYYPEKKPQLKTLNRLYLASRYGSTAAAEFIEAVAKLKL